MDEQEAGRQSGPAELAARVALLEEALGRLHREIRTKRLAVLDEAGGERIVAEVTDGVAVLHLRLPGESAVGDGLVLFAARAGEDLPPASGLQLWGEGEVRRHLEWWEGG